MDTPAKPGDVHPSELFLVTYGDEREPTPRGVDRRNVAVIGAPGAGVTILVERMVVDAEL